ncbi:hypothetical protein LUZ60_015465 [Juncus effusus]|nr:hypothetical protein LUZ60_015465 [Juncus effusus]
MFITTSLSSLSLSLTKPRTKIASSSLSLSLSLSLIMTETFSTTKPTTDPTPKPKTRRRCCLYTCLSLLFLLILLIIIVVILIFTVFKVRDPTISLTSTRLSGIAPRVTLPAFSIDLNITLDIIVTVKNPNRASFTHGTGQTNLLYRGTQVGQAVIEPGRIPDHGSGPVRLTLTLEADQFADKLGNLITDVLNGSISFDSNTTIPGRVTILGFIKHHAVAKSTCHVEIGVPDMKVKSQDCDSKTTL